MTCRTLRLGLPLLVGALLVACTQAPLTGQATPRPTPSGVQETAAPASPPVSSGAFDPAHVAAVLSPAVGMVIVNEARGISEGSTFGIAHSGDLTYLVTNNHVIASGTRIQVLFLDGRHFDAKLKGTDPVEDVAVLSIADGSLPLASFADSSKLTVGQQVVAIGSPLGTQGSVTSGIISALHRSISAGGGTSGPSESLPDVLQTDAAINPGNSGGPLADADGHVVGINTAANTSATNVGFAIPSLLVKRIADDLIAGRKPGHPFLGVGLEDESQALAAGKSIPGPGTYVNEVLPGLAADKAGVRVGDVIQKVDGVELINGQTLGGVLQLHEVGDHVKLSLLRGSTTVEVDVVLGDRPANA